MSIYSTGDTHGDITDPRLNYLKQLKENDILIITGDFGFDWNKEFIDSWLEFEHKYTVLFCDGNHENYDVLNSLPIEKMFGDEVGVFGNNTYRLLTGHMYNIEGEKFFVFGGASSIDKSWRRTHEIMHNQPRTLWWPEEVPTEETFELAKKTLADNNYKFDYFISHTCIPQLKGAVLHTYKTDFYDPTESMINSIEYLIKENNGGFKHAFFGHFHTNLHFRNYHALYGDIVNITDKVIIKGFDEFSHETWEKIPLEDYDDDETSYI